MNTPTPEEWPASLARDLNIDVAPAIQYAFRAAMEQARQEGLVRGWDEGYKEASEKGRKGAADVLITGTTPRILTGTPMPSPLCPWCGHKKHERKGQWILCCHGLCLCSELRSSLLQRFLTFLHHAK